MSSATPPPSAVTAAVATVSYGSAGVLPQFLGSIPGASTLALSVIVADNQASGDEAIATIASQHGAQYFPLVDNVGYGGALNAAVKVLPESVKWILLSNPDVILGDGVIDTLIAAGETDPRIASVGPRILTSEGELYPSARSIPSLRTGVGHALLANIWVDNPWTRAYRKDTEDEPVGRDAGWLSGACLIVRRSAFEEIGGFDSSYFMYFEDVDLGYRFGRAGYRNVYEPLAVVTHTGAHSTQDNGARMIATHHESARRFLARKYSGWFLWPVRAVLTVGLRLRASVVSRRLGRH